MSDPQSLKDMGLKATVPRLKILELFEKAAFATSPPRTFIAC